MNNLTKLLLISIAFHVLPKVTFSQNTTPAIEYDSRTGQFGINNLGKPQDWGKTGYNGKTAFWGIFFWDFGDGNYFMFDRTKDSEKVEFPSHRYAEGRSHNVTLYLTPAYSPDKARKITYTVASPATGKPSGESGMQGKLVNIQTSSSDRIIPGEEVRVAVHYEAPADGKGTLLIFYDKGSGLGKVGFEPLKMLNVQPYYGEKKYSGVANTFINSNLKKDALPTASQMLAGNTRYKNVDIYSVKDMKKGEQCRLFFSLLSDRGLDNFRKNKVNLHIAAMWVPDGGTFNKAKMLKELTFSLPEVHDPNNIIGPKVMYFRRGHPKEMEYMVNFENTEKGVVKDVGIVLPTGKGFKSESLKVNTNEMDPPCRECPSSNYQDSVCWRKQISPDSIVLTFHNIGLQGKTTLLTKKASKGRIGFTIQNNPRYKPKSKLQARIDFRGAEPIKTRKAVTKWRHRALYLRPGYTFGLNKDAIPANMDTVANWSKDLSFAISYQNAPLGNGLVWGYELGTASVRFFQENTTVVPPNFNFLGDGGYLTEKQMYHLRFLEARALGGYQLLGFARIIGGIGVTVPAFARMDVSADASYSGDGPPIYSAHATKNYGLFQDKGQDAFVYNQALENKPSLGVVYQLGVEVGLMNGLTLGLEQQVRYFPNFYKEGCATLSNLNLSLRFKLIPLVSKNLK